MATGVSVGDPWQPASKTQKTRPRVGAPSDPRSGALMRWSAHFTGKTWDAQASVCACPPNRGKGVPKAVGCSEEATDQPGLGSDRDQRASARRPAGHLSCFLETVPQAI